MKKKDYIFNMANLIKNRVNYHAPISYDGDVDFEKILSKNIDLTLPVFIMEKPISKPLLKAFKMAQKEVSFNLILRKKDYRAKKIKNCFVVKESEIPSLNKLNINYKACSSYHKLEQGNYLKIGEIIEDYEEKQFYLEKKFLYQSVFVTVKKFLLNGENILIELVNTSNDKAEVSLEYNRELEKGYYLFEKTKFGVKISNLLKNSEQFFNASFGKILQAYSCVDGLENSSYARINCKANITLKSYEKKSVLFSFGSKEFMLNNASEMLLYFNLAQKKNFEVFDLRVCSENKTFERRFNKILPIKIWRSWLEGRRDYESEQKYLDIKNSIISRSDKGVFFLPNPYKILFFLEFDGKNYKKLPQSREM